MLTNKRHLKFFRALALLVLTFFVFSGCAQTMRAIENAKMTTTVKMSDTIFLDPNILSKNRNVFVRVTNTSDMQEIRFEPLLREKLSQKGLNLVSDPLQAGYVIQANVLYMDYEKSTLTADGMVAGGFGGAIAGASMGGDWKGSGTGAVIGGVVGSLIGGAIGAAFKVETFFGAVDVQIKEKVEGGVTGTMRTDAKQGSSTTLTTERDIKSDFQEYRTRIVAKAKQTNIDRAEAAQAISERLAAQIAGLF